MMSLVWPPYWWNWNSSYLTISKWFISFKWMYNRNWRINANPKFLNELLLLITTHILSSIYIFMDATFYIGIFFEIPMKFLRLKSPVIFVFRAWCTFSCSKLIILNTSFRWLIMKLKLNRLAYRVLKTL